MKSTRETEKREVLGGVRLRTQKRYGEGERAYIISSSLMYQMVWQLTNKDLNFKLR